MVSRKKFSRVVLWATLDNFVNMEICAAITEKIISFNISPTIHRIISMIVSTHMFSWSSIRIITLEMLYHEIECSLTKIMSRTS